jgi:cold shock CspA family protein
MFGIIKFFNYERSFGFIKSDDKEFYFNGYGVLDEEALTPGQQVEFELERTPANKKKAVNVRLI